MDKKNLLHENVYATYNPAAAALGELCVAMQGDRCAIEVRAEDECVKPYNINEYNISRLINNPDSLAPRGVYYPPASSDFFLL